MTPSQAEKFISAASQKLADYCMNSRLDAVITGVSGGLDSAVTLGLAQKAQQMCFENGYPLKNVGIILPCHSDPDHAIRAKKAILTFNAEEILIDLTGIFDLIEQQILEPTSEALGGHVDQNHLSARYRTAQGNVKARLRMTLGTYYIANMMNGLVLSTDNFSEYWMGFWTLHGDVGDYGMIQEVWKGDELPVIAKILGVPQEIIDAAPTDGLGVLPGGDEAQLGASYPVVDKILKSLIEAGVDLNGSIEQINNLPKIAGVDDQLVKKIASRAIKNAFKRRNPKNLSRGEVSLDEA